ncbi:unnamed protein product, partial [Brassica rapa]
MSSLWRRLLSGYVFSVNRCTFSAGPSSLSLSLRYPLIRSVMGFSSTSSPKLLFRQLLKKKSSTFMYLLADVSHPECNCCVCMAHGTHSLSETDSTSSTKEV